MGPLTDLQWLRDFVGNVMANLGIRLEQRLSQNLVMTPRLQQAIKLLQLNHVEMVKHIQDAMLENPTLEPVPDTASADADNPVDVRDRSDERRKELAEERGGVEGSLDWEKVVDHLNDRSGIPRGALSEPREDHLPAETNLTYGESLADHLCFQLHLIKCGSDERRVADQIIHNLDHRGYLALPLEEIVEQLEERPDVEVVDEALELVQSLDPLGCGARDLGECLAIQTRRLFPEDRAFETIVSEHLGHLERRNYGAIAKALDIDVEDVVEYHKMIQELEPLPGRGFAAEEPRYISPDVHVTKRDGIWTVSVNEDGLPELRVSRYYQDLLATASKADRDYLLDKLGGAEFLIKSVHKRRRTILRVMESIVKFQHGFFDAGVAELKPLVLQDVADDVGVHMSTVSRVTTNKYVHTPHGLFELKYFFGAGVRQGSGEDMAGEAIRDRIRQLVADEDTAKPMSDQALATLLKAEGIAVARRTVAKYREALGILPSSKRKKMF